MNEKEISVTVKAPYYTRGPQGMPPRSIWVACHGYGQMAKYFGRRFDVLDEQQDLLIVPQGLSRFYLDAHKGQYQHVGASWMTKERRELDIAAQMQYLDKVFDLETQKLNLEKVKLVLMGFSQGTATICRWAVHRRLPIDKLVIWGGNIAHEHTSTDWNFLPAHTEVLLVVGKTDQFFTPEKIGLLAGKITKVIKKPRVVQFDGGHEVKREVLESIANS